MSLHSLSVLIAENKARWIAEIGILQGRLTRRVFEQIEPRQILMYYMVDPWECYKDGSSTGYNTTQEQMDSMYEANDRWAETRWNACVLRMKSVEAAELFPDNVLDLVYIDAAHDTYSVLSDIRAWTPKIKDGGVISGHDYGGGWKSVVRGVDLAFPNFDPKTRLPGTVWHVRLDPRVKESVRLNTEIVMPGTQ